MNEEAIVDLKEIGGGEDQVLFAVYLESAGWQVSACRLPHHLSRSLN